MEKGLRQPSKYVNLHVLCFLEPPDKVPHSFYRDHESFLRQLSVCEFAVSAERLPIHLHPVGLDGFLKFASLDPPRDGGHAYRGLSSPIGQSGRDGSDWFA